MTGAAKVQPRFLVIRGGAIGDFIVTLPALAALRSRWPTAYIECLGYPHIAELAKESGYVNAVRSLEEAQFARMFAPDAPLEKNHTEYFSAFEMIVSYLHDPESVLKENLLRAGASLVVRGTPFVTTAPAAEVLFEPLSELAIFPEKELIPRVVFSNERVRAAQDRLKELGVGGSAIALHPGSGSPKKNWPTERFLAVADKLAADGRGEPFFIIGEADQELFEAYRGEFERYRVLHHIPLTDLGATLQQCRGFVGNDSGVTHLACAAGTPVVSLFGPSNPDIWGGHGAQVVVLEAPAGELRELDVDTVYDVIVSHF